MPQNCRIFWTDTKRSSFQDWARYLVGRDDPDVQPRFLKARPVPYALWVNVEKELDKLEEEGVIVPVQHSEWATPIVPMLKGKGTVKICGDFKETANKPTKMKVYPLPWIEDLFASLARGTVLSKLDLSHVYP